MSRDNHVLKSTLDAVYPVVDHGEGVYIYDTEGNRY